MIGSIIWEYLSPLFVNDSSHYLLEQQLVQFFFEMVNMPTLYCTRLMNLVFQTVEMHFSGE